MPLKRISKRTKERIEDLRLIYDTREIDILNNIVVNDIRYISECKENDITDFYIKYYRQNVSDNPDYKLTDKTIPELQLDVRSKLASKYISTESFDNSIDAYFNSVSKEYILCPVNTSNELEALPENRDIFVKNNLKTVINCAKRYRGLGVPFEDLIQAGNLGLLEAYKKFDGSKAQLRNAIMDDIKNSPLDKFTYDEAAELVKSNYSYGTQEDKVVKKIPASGFDSKEDFLSWTEKNIKKALFSSLGFIWCRTWVTNEITNYVNIIKVPNSKKPDTRFYNLDDTNPYTDDNYNDNIFAEPELMDDMSSMELEEQSSHVKETIARLLDVLSPKERRIVSMMYGIGYPCEMCKEDIAEVEGITVRDVKLIWQYAQKKWQRTIEREGLKLYSN